MEAIEAAPARWTKAVESRSAEEIDARPAPGKWSLREVLAHLADCEIAFGFRLRQGLAGVSIQPFDQDDWAKSYAGYTAEAALKTYRAMREWNLALIRGMSEEEKKRVVVHPERGEMVVWTIVETMGGHDLHHLGIVER